MSLSGLMYKFNFKWILLSSLVLVCVLYLAHVFIKAGG